MHPIARYIKDPDERKRYTINYAQWLDDGERLVDVEFSVEPTSPDPVIVTDAQISPDGTRVQYYLEGGVDNQEYMITARVTTTGNQIKEAVIVCAVMNSVSTF